MRTGHNARRLDMLLCTSPSTWDPSMGLVWPALDSPAARSTSWQAPEVRQWMERASWSVFEDGRKEETRTAHVGSYCIC